MEKQHQYSLAVKWTGNTGQGTAGYRQYERSHTILVDGKAEIKGSSDPNFRGDASRHNPEELFLASLSACHLLWYLHLCAENGVVVTDYVDQASGVMQETTDGGGRFIEVVLHPVVTVADEAMLELARSLHQAAHAKCFIANSCNFPVRHEPQSRVA
ncbi:MAG: OsmC family protein [Saprospiraceae bacterium]